MSENTQEQKQEQKQFTKFETFKLFLIENNHFLDLYRNDIHNFLKVLSLAKVDLTDNDFEGIETKLDSFVKAMQNLQESLSELLHFEKVEVYFKNEKKVN